MNARVSSQQDDLMEITLGIGPLFLMEHFFNKKKGKPYSFFALVGDYSYSSVPGTGYTSRDEPLVVLGSKVAEINFHAHIKAEDFREESNLIVPATGEDVKRDNFISVDILCAEDDYFEDQDMIRFPVEAWTCIYFLDSEHGEHVSLGWMIESRMADPISWMVFNKHTHEITVS